MKQKQNQSPLSGLNELDRKLLNDYQHDLPLSPTPYADMAKALGVSEEEVIARLERLHETGAVSRVGAVFRPKRLGASTLAAMSVPSAQLNEVAMQINEYDEVNHNYERDHHFNLWFVVTAPDETRLQAVLRDIERRTGLQVMSLPMIEAYHIDLGFDIQFGDSAGVQQ